MSKFLRFFLVIGFIVFISSLGNAQETIGVKVNKEKVETGEIFLYVIKIEGVFNSPELILPKFKNFHVASQSQSRNYSFNDEGMKLMLSLTYQLFAPEPGVFAIEEVVVKDGDQEFKSKPVSIEVTGEPLPKKKLILPYIKKGTEI